MSANSSISDDDDDDDANFTSIFDDKSLKGWDMAGNGKF
jgi:hypothetical protein